jgi:mannose-6-phosphate isomerase-like protein (cupin superfamily)
MPMGRKQKETVELRFYEIPQGEPVLALLGEEWNRVYGHDNFYLHFHNLMEIGICRKGEGELIINEHTYIYRTNSVTLIPPNIPHTTISNGMTRNSWEFLYVDVNHRGTVW